MRCPFCNSEESKVVDSRDSEAGDAIRRRRECLDCERRYTTYERIEEVPLVVVKSDGREELFTRQKVLNGLLARARSATSRSSASSAPATTSRTTCAASSGRPVTSRTVGDLAPRDLRDIDKVASISKFASL